ncbi:MAG: DUF2304 domain-containing protein [Desulfosoma sp.]|uniref:DUF2304 domain-containing protein n=1 Tax=Desulfosoma sp. TaxID=2603217 RepID=UPI00404AFDC6
MNYRVASALIGLGLSAVILLLIRRDRLHVRYALWWIGVAAATAVLGLVPQIIDVLGKRLGIHYPPVLLLVVALGLLLVKTLTMDIERTRLEQKIRRLAQEMAMHQKDMGPQPSDPCTASACGPKTNKETEINKQTDP